MDHFGSLFYKFKKFTVPNKDVRECVVQSCGLFIKRDLSISSVRVSGRILYLDLHPTVKGDVLLNKNKILDNVNTMLKSKQQQVFLDIR